MSKTKILWPSWRYGPNGEAQIFDHADEVPTGWEDHPSKIGNETDKKAAKEPAKSDDKAAKAAERAAARAATKAAKEAVKTDYTVLNREELEKVATNRGFVVESTDPDADVIAALEQDDKENGNGA